MHPAKLNVRNPFEAYSPSNLEEQLKFVIFLEQENITLDDVNLKSFLRKYHDYEDLKFNEEMFQIIDNAAMNLVTSAFASEKDLRTAEKWHKTRDQLRVNLSEYFRTHYDGVIVEKSVDNLDLPPFDQIGVFSPDQIHLVGSKQDLQGFRDFIATFTAHDIQSS